MNDENVVGEPREKNPGSPQKLKIADRRFMALTLRRQGGSYRQIARQLPEEARKRGIDIGVKRYSQQTAYLDVMAELKRLNRRNGEEAAEILRLELERLDELLACYYPKAAKGDYAAAQTVFGILDRRARYLNLYAASSEVKIDITLHVRQLAEQYGFDPDEAVKEAMRIINERQHASG